MASPIPLLDTAELLAIAAQAKAMVAKYTPLNMASVSQSPAEQEVSPSSAVQLSAEQAAAIKELELELELVLAALGYQVRGTFGSGSWGTVFKCVPHPCPPSTVLHTRILLLCDVRHACDWSP